MCKLIASLNPSQQANKHSKFIIPKMFFWMETTSWYSWHSWIWSNAKEITLYNCWIESCPIAIHLLQFGAARNQHPFHMPRSPMTSPWHPGGWMSFCAMFSGSMTWDPSYGDPSCCWLLPCCASHVVNPRYPRGLTPCQIFLTRGLLVASAC